MKIYINSGGGCKHHIQINATEILTEIEKEGSKAMGNKKIFISDIHMGDERSETASHPYVWFGKENASLLAWFLRKLLENPGVKELIILGDLFDQWIIPANYSPITKLDTICSNKIYADVISGLKDLAASPDIRLTYVPGNHDMALDFPGISATRQFLKGMFPGMNFLCEDAIPLGIYKNGTIVAEHGNRYCLFNAPDIVSVPKTSFLPLGYFISRLDTYRVCEKGHSSNVFDIFIKLVEEYLRGNDNFVEDVFLSTAQDCGLGNGTIEVDGLPGYGSWMPVADIAARFSQIAKDWGKIPGTEYVDVRMAAEGDELGLFPAAKAAYFQVDPQSKVVIFGHTHKAEIQPNYENTGDPNYIVNPDETPCLTIYANSGAWTDAAKPSCTYVETEEDGKKLHVRVKQYRKDASEDAILGYGFVEI